MWEVVSLTSRIYLILYLRFVHLQSTPVAIRPLGLHIACFNSNILNIPTSV